MREIMTPERKIWPRKEKLKVLALFGVIAAVIVPWAIWAANEPRVNTREFATEKGLAEVRANGYLTGICLLRNEHGEWRYETTASPDPSDACSLTGGEFVA